ncbi:MAG: DNA sulfur modification protein DndD [Thermosipho sp. (in: Bacteria)]|nr:DNA sulfur modification protein DndD [Thermosipho sp. (in: thermotogales)]
MIFDFIQFNNYRPFYGTQQIIFRTTTKTSSPYKKNIILIGGLNGSGKTSLINAIYVCLYGRRFFNKEEYEDIKANAINRRFLREGGRKSSIRLGFSESERSYTIEISFTLQGNNIEEERTIYQFSKNKKEHRITSTEEEFNSFIDRRIPIYVAPFFIFDAEKIRDLVGNHEKEDTREAIQKVVSLDLYKQLLKDLRQERAKEEKNLNKSIKDKDIKELTKKLKEDIDRLEKLREKQKEYKQKLNVLKEQKQEVERARRKKLAESSMTKQQLNRLLGNIENELKTIEKELKQIGHKKLVYFLLASSIKELKDRIKKEQEYLKAKQRLDIALAPYEDFMNQLISLPIQPPLTEQQKQTLYDKGRKIWAQINKIQEDLSQKELTIWHDLSQSDLSKLLNWPMPKDIDITSILNKYQELLQKKANYEAQLSDAPEEIDTKEEDKQLESINKEIGSLNTLVKNQQEKIIELEDEISRIQNHLTRKRKLQKELGPVEQKIDLLDRLIAATEEFVEQVTVYKAEQLKLHIEDILNRLFRKDDLAIIKFDPKTYTLHIFSEYGEEIDLHSRSEGEKQIIALAMIWALTKVSGADFPFVIDTPLARLDSIHRYQMVSHFFTNLSDQVIILSTDTEITQEFIKEIEPYVQCSYLLEYSNEEESTQIKEGYFDFADETVM